MSLHPNGAYVDDGSQAYEIESAYYLDFQIQSALTSMKLFYTSIDESVWNSKYQYYHYHSDHLLFSMGQIANRFIGKKDEGRKRTNRENFRFSENDYPLLSNKAPRNAIEHIDERNVEIIKKKQGVGGFNAIDKDTPSELADTLRTKRDINPYVLDLVSGELLIRDGNNDLTIRLEELEKELLSLQQSVKTLLKFATEFY